MTLPSQFSLEEENFYKDIQDLVKNGSQNEKELSSFLQRYMDLLGRADIDEESFVINFTKAGLIIEASAKVYGTKVDRLWINLEHVLESLKNKSQGQGCKKKSDCEDDVGDEMDMDGAFDEEGKRKLANSGKRKKKLGDALLSSDDFLEIDNITGLFGKNMNETIKKNESKLKLCEKVPNMFIKNKTKKKKIDVCLNKCLEDKDVIRLRDWVISAECLLVKEIYTSLVENVVFNGSLMEQDEIKATYYDSETYKGDDNALFEGMEVNSGDESITVTENLKDEKNNNSETGIDLEKGLKDPTSTHAEKVLSVLSEEKDNLIDQLNVSKESVMAKYPNVAQISEDCLVDIDEVFWNTSKFQDVIPSKKMRAWKTNKLPCQLCANKKVHKKKGKPCIEGKQLDCMDSYFSPHVQPTISDPLLGIMLDENLYSVFKTEMKLIEHLGKMNTCRNINEAYHPGERPEELKNFMGFDDFENCLLRKTADLQEDDIPDDILDIDHVDEENNENFTEDPPLDNEFELPFPVTENTVKSSILLRDNDPEPDVDDLINSESEYQKLVIEELKDHYAAKSSFAKNKELGIKISKWHEMIADKIKLSQKRGALNMNVLASKIMSAFTPCRESEPSKMTFCDLVRQQSQRDIPRYFFACLQLTNEGNLDISKSDSQSLATDCMVITQLRSTRNNYELEECSAKSPAKVFNSSTTPIKRKRNSQSPTQSIPESKNLSKKKKLKTKIVKSHKRPKNFSSLTNSKRRRCSLSSAGSFGSD